MSPALAALLAFAAMALLVSAVGVYWPKPPRGLFFYDPDSVVVTIGGREFRMRGLDEIVKPEVTYVTYARAAMAMATGGARCAWCMGPIEPGDECVVVEGKTYCPFCGCNAATHAG